MGRFVSAQQSQSVSSSFANRQLFTEAGQYDWTAPTGVTKARVVTVGGGGTGIDSAINFRTERCCVGSCIDATLVTVCTIRDYCSDRVVCCISPGCCIISGNICGCFNLICSDEVNLNCRCITTCSFCRSQFCDICTACISFDMKWQNYNCSLSCTICFCNNCVCYEPTPLAAYRCIILNNSIVASTGGSGGGYSDGTFVVTPGSTYSVCVGDTSGTSSFGSCISATGGSSVPSLDSQSCLRLFVDGLFHPPFCTRVQFVRCANSCGCSPATACICWIPGSINCAVSCNTGGCCCITITSPTGCCLCSFVCIRDCNGYNGTVNGACSILGFIHGKYKYTLAPGCGIGGQINTCGATGTTSPCYNPPIFCMLIEGCVCCTLHVQGTCAYCHDYYFTHVNKVTLCGYGINGNPGAWTCFKSPCNLAAGGSGGSFYGNGVGNNTCCGYLLCCSACACLPCCIESSYGTLCLYYASGNCCLLVCYNSSPLALGGTGIGTLGTDEIGGGAVKGSTVIAGITNGSNVFVSPYTSSGDTVHFIRTTANDTISGINMRSDKHLEWFSPEDIKGLGARCFSGCCISIFESAGPGAGGLCSPSGILAGASTGSCGAAGNGGGGTTAVPGGAGLVIVYY